jgi:hypothetical protein
MDAAAVRSLLLRLALVVGVVAGLLAMHTVITGPAHAATAVTVEHHAADAGEPMSESPAFDECGSSGCEPLHAMGVMACMLALLVAWVLTGAAPPAGRWKNDLPAAVLALAQRPRSVGPPPPSLIALSISRT